MEFIPTSELENVSKTISKPSSLSQFRFSLNNSRKFF